MAVVLLIIFGIVVLPAQASHLINVLRMKGHSMRKQLIH